MQALLFGLIAALSWGLHDFCVRYVSQRTSIPTAILTVLCSGAILICVVSIIWGDWQDLNAQAVQMAALSGVVFSGGLYALYRAFAIGPVKLVAPITGSFPILTVAISTLQGQPISFGQVIAIFVIVGAVGCVAIFSQEQEETGASLTAVIWGILAACGFALTFAAGQEATRAGAELPVLMLTRGASILALLAAILLTSGRPTLPSGRVLPVLFIMGALDMVALGLVLISGRLPNPEFASVSSSLFGLITVILAWMILKEKVAPLQWVSIAAAFAGIAYLAG